MAWCMPEICSTPICATSPRAFARATSAPRTFGRGVEVALTCDETLFQGSGVFLFGAVMARFFAKYVSINSFTETVLRSENRGEINRWGQQWGARPTL